MKFYVFLAASLLVAIPILAFAEGDDEARNPPVGAPAPPSAWDHLSRDFDLDGDAIQIQCASCNGLSGFARLDANRDGVITQADASHLPPPPPPPRGPFPPPPPPGRHPLPMHPPGAQGAAGGAGGAVPPPPGHPPRPR